MTQQIINVGTSDNAGDGDTLREGFIKTNENFTEIYNAGPVGSNIRIANNTIRVTNTNGNIEILPSGLGRTLLGLPARVSITGGSPGWVLGTDGTGNLGWQAPANVTLTATGNIVPGVANTFYLGTSTNRWFQFWANTANITTVTVGTLTSAGNVTAVGGTFTGNLTVGNIITTGNFVATSFSGDQMTANNFTGDLLGNVYGTGNILAFNKQTRAFTANTLAANVITATSGTFSGGVTAGSITGVLIGNIFGGATVLGNLTATNIIQASELVSTGQIRGVTTIQGGNLVANLAIQTPGTITAGGLLQAGNITTAGNITASGNVSGAFILGNGSQLTGLPEQYGNANVAAYLPSYTGNLNPTNLTISGIVTLTGNGTFGNITTARITSAGITNTGTLNTAGNINVTGTGNITTVGNVSAQAYFGNGRALSGMYGNADVAAFLPTYTGNLAAGNISIASAINAPSIVANLITGTLTTAAQPNITSVGTLTSLTAAGNITAANFNTSGRISATTGNITNMTVGQGVFSNVISPLGTINNFSATIGTFGNIAGTITTAAQPFITAVGTLSTLNVTGNIISGNISGGGSALTNLNATQLTSGTVPSARLTGPYTGVNAVGTLNGLSVTGAIVATGNITGGNLLSVDRVTTTGNITAGNLISNAAIIASTTITAPGTITGGSFQTIGAISAGTGNISGGNLILTGSANIGGSVNATGNITGAFLFGNGSAITGIDLTRIVSGTSNVQVVSAGGNVRVNIGGSSNVAVFSTAGANIIGAFGATGNITGSFILGNGRFLTGMYGNADVATYLPTYTGNLNPNIVTTSGNLTVGGNIAGGNLSLSGALNATGNLTVTSNINATQNITASGNVTGANLVVTTGNIFIGNVPFVRTLAVGTRVAPVFVPLASNNSFNVLGRTGNVPVYTT